MIVTRNYINKEGVEFSITSEGVKTYNHVSRYGASGVVPSDGTLEFYTDYNITGTPDFFVELKSQSEGHMDFIEYGMDEEGLMLQSVFIMNDSGKTLRSFINGTHFGMSEENYIKEINKRRHVMEERIKAEEELKKQIKEDIELEKKVKADLTHLGIAK